MRSRSQETIRAPVAIYLNVAEDHFCGYQPGDELHKVYEYAVDVSQPPGDVAEHAFRMFNAPREYLEEAERHDADRYRAGHNRSLSVGDVVVVGEIALAVASVGFQPASIDASQVRTDTPPASGGRARVEALRRLDVVGTNDPPPAASL